MASSKTTTKKKSATKVSDEPVESVAAAQRQSKRKPTATRRVPVQYTPRIPTARCPGC